MDCRVKAFLTSTTAISTVIGQKELLVLQVFSSFNSHLEFSI